MKRIKNELQNIIIGDGQAGGGSQLKKTQVFLRRYAQTSENNQSKKHFKKQEEVGLKEFAERENLFFTQAVSEDKFVASGAEQRVYRFDEYHVFKLNDAIFYETWLDYFNNLLIHNYFFQSTAYDFLGFVFRNETFYAVVKQEFIAEALPANLEDVKRFLEFNKFKNTRRNDYFNEDLGLIFEDLHDENVLTKNNLLYFIDTIFYLTESFYSLWNYATKNTFTLRN